MGKAKLANMKVRPATPIDLSDADRIALVADALVELIYDELDAAEESALCIAD